jgi:RsbT co-antagonist protein rsbRD N-terminal domain
VSTPLGLDRALRDHGNDVLESWMVRFERSPTRLRRTIEAKTYAAQAASLIEALAVAASGGRDELRAGSPLTRELERACAFLGAQFASAAASGFDVAAFVLALRDAVLEFAGEGSDAHAEHETQLIVSLFEWLSLVALDSFATAGILSLQERTTEQLEAGTPVVQLAPKVAAVLLVGGPTTSTMDSVLSRGLMLAIGIGSNCLIVDVSGLSQPSLQLFPRTIAAFVERERLPSIELLLVAAPRTISDACSEMLTRLGSRLSALDQLDTAVERALDRNGYSLVRRS